MVLDRSDPRFWGGTKLPDNYISRPTEFHVLKFRIHHKGEWVCNPSMEYINGEVHEMLEGWDVDHISAIEFSKVVKSLGYVSWEGIWYKHPELDISVGLRPLNTDKDVIQFISDVKGCELVELFVQHALDIPQRVEPGKENESDGVETENDTPHDSDGVKPENDTPHYSAESEDEDYVANSDDHGHESEVSLDDSECDESWDWTINLPPETLDPPMSNREAERTVHGDSAEDSWAGRASGSSSVRVPASSRNVVPTTAADFSDENGDSEDLDSPPSSGEEDCPRKKYPKFKMPKDSGKVVFELGLTFTTRDLVKDAVKEYAMSEKKNVFLAKNDNMRVVIKCMTGCPFYVRVSKRRGSHYYQVVTSETTHTCHRTAKNRQAKTSWLAKKFMSTLRHSPQMKTKALIEESREKWGVRLSKYQAYRAKKMALEHIQGAVADQFLHLRSYCEELRRSNPGSTVIIKCEVGSKGPVFQRLYVCFQACKAAYVTTCRPLIGLDGCFLKGVYGGQLLAAIGKDGNNQMFPIAFAVVEAETRDSWSWFVELLLQDLDSIQKKKWSFISDQQKGLVPTLAALDALVEHRLCVKHLYGNWRKRYPGLEMKEQLWRAARAQTVTQWKRTMETLKEMNEQAWREMMDIPATMWSRSAFSTYTLCDLQVNNMCEAFNSAILEHRDKPIISLVESLRIYMSERFVRLRDLMLRYKGSICPMIQKNLEKIKTDADGWMPHWCGDEAYSLFEVTKGNGKYVVNLSERTCACRKWDLSGVPCSHAVACLWHNNYIPEDYVASFYSKQMFLQTYSHIILPCNGPSLWPITDSEPIHPPFMRRAPGRPKKQRIKNNDEPRNPNKLPRNHKTVKCSRCGNLGHNKASCKGKTAADRVIPKGGNKKNKQVQQHDGATTTTRKRPRRARVQGAANAENARPSGENAGPSGVTGSQVVSPSFIHVQRREYVATQESQAPK